MSTSHDPIETALDDAGLPDTAMDSGSDAGEPGGHLGPGDLDPEEERLLAALERDADPRPSAGPETYAAVRAAEDEGPLPARGGPQDDGLTPRFSSPGEA
jgi:hypothetical protein